MKEQENNFNAVDFQRKRREELSKLKNSDQSAFEEKLQEIRERYSKKFKLKKKNIA